MPTAAPELPPITDQTKFNVERWDELCADRFYASLDHRIETDTNGKVIVRGCQEISHTKDAQEF
jgi:hypothetical protein